MSKETDAFEMPVSQFVPAQFLSLLGGRSPQAACAGAAQDHYSLNVR